MNKNQIALTSRSNTRSRHQNRELAKEGKSQYDSAHSKSRRLHGHASPTVAPTRHLCRRGRTSRLRGIAIPLEPLQVADPGTCGTTDCARGLREANGYHGYQPTPCEHAATDPKSHAPGANHQSIRIVFGRDQSSTNGRIGRTTPKSHRSDSRSPNG